MNSGGVIKVLLLLGAIAVSFIALDRIEIPYDDFFWRSVQNAGHAPFFGLLALLFLALSVSVLGRRVRTQSRHYLIAFILASLGGVASELAQILGPRDADIWDLMRDVAGILFFLTVVSLFDRKMTGFWAGLPRGLKSTTVLITLGLFGAVWIPVASWGIASWQRDEAFPILCDFESMWGNKFVTSRNADLAVVAPPADWSENLSGAVVRVTFDTVTYPTVFLDEPYSDWRGYEHLKFDVYSENSENLNLFLTVHDLHHDMEYADRFNRMVPIEPGYNSVIISLEDIRQAPKDRLMDMAAIATIHLFLSNPSQPVTLYFDNFRLQ